MKQSRYWMRTKEKGNFISHFQSSVTTNGESWEEQAFAEDAAGTLGECIWPPRSYHCSFCRREFRSAQALGGHMNVHRRDRARLKQSSDQQHEVLHHDNQLNHHNTIQNSFTPFGFQYPSPAPGFVGNTNPKSDLSAPSSCSRFSVLSTKEYHRESVLLPQPQPFSASFMDEKSRRSPITCLQSRSSLEAGRYIHDSEPKSKREKLSLIFESEVMRDPVKTDEMPKCLSLAIHLARPADSDENERGIFCKRRRTKSQSTSFLQSGPVGRNQDQKEVLGLGSGSIGELDLELRLGRQPKVL